MGDSQNGVGWPKTGRNLNQRLFEVVVWESLAIVALLVVIWNLWPVR